MGSILVLDDSDLARATASRALTDAGHTVIAAASPEEAAALEPTTLGAAVLDVEIGEGSGVDVALGLLSRDEKLPIAFLTADASPAARAKAAALGPVFDKMDGVDAIVAWVRDHAR